MNSRSSAQQTPARGAGEPARTAFDWPRDAGVTDAVLLEMEVQLRARRRHHRRLVGMAVAGSILLTGVFAWRHSPSLQSRTPEASSAIAYSAERQVLPDGTVISLRPGAEVRVDFSPKLRQVFLERGEALFEVRKDMDRPFLVRAGAVTVRAVGTAFVVDLSQTAVEVLVTEGRVAVEKQHQPGGTEIAPGEDAPSVSRGDDLANATLAIVPAGNRVVVENLPVAVSPQIISISEDEIKARLGWRGAKLQFSRTPLKQVITMVRQHTGIRLVLVNRELEHAQLSGVLRADDIDTLFQLLEADYGITTSPRGESEFVLRKSR